MTRDPQTNTLPYLFDSLHEARRTLDDLLNRVHCLKRHFRESVGTSKPADSAKIFDEQRRILADMTLWRQAYDATIPRFDTEASRKDKFGLLFLRVYFEMGLIMASICLSHNQVTDVNAYTDNFVAVMTGFLNLSWSNINTPKQIAEFVEKSKGRGRVLDHCTLESMEQGTNALQNSWDLENILISSECGGHGFTVEMGYIPPIYYTALKCRVPRIRRQAIRTLQGCSPLRRRLEWAADGLLEEVLKVEEGDFYAGDPFIDEPLGMSPLTERDLSMPKVPISQRIYDVAVLLPGTTATGDVSITYRKRDANGKWINFKRKVGS